MSLQTRFVTVAVAILGFSIFVGTARAADPFVATAPTVRIGGERFRGGLFQHGQIYFAGYPTDADVAWAQGEGVTTVISLLSDEEVAERNIQPSREMAERRDMIFVPTPIGASSPATPATLAAIREAIAASDGKVLVHCWSSSRAMEVWMALMLTVDTAQPGLASDRHRQVIGRSNVELLTGQDFDLIADVSN
jgi:protein tyrosine phosphatase (PTP) superfamily phosphohydrolase (DUF442 family)